jgi:hypothetical protein
MLSMKENIITAPSMAPTLRKYVERLLRIIGIAASVMVSPEGICKARQ